MPLLPTYLSLSPGFCHTICQFQISTAQIFAFLGLISAFFVCYSHLHSSKTQIKPGQWALVTGASSGIGKSYALQLAQRGVHCVVTARRTERLESLSDHIERNFNVSCIVISQDISTPIEIKQLLKKIDTHPQIPKIDIVINNAGVGSCRPFLNLSAEQASRMINLNCTAVSVISRHFAKKMVQINSGIIINVSSLTAASPVPFMADYAASKSFVNYFTLALQSELALVANKINVQVVRPGPVKTEFFQHAVDGDPKKYDRFLYGSSTPDQVAKTSLNYLKYGRQTCHCNFTVSIVFSLLQVLPLWISMPFSGGLIRLAEYLSS